MHVGKTGRIAALLLSFATAGFTGTALGKDQGAWPVKHRLFGKDGGKARDISGIACATAQGFPRSCLVIDDNAQEAQFVTLTDGKLVAGTTVSLIGDKFKGEALELDGEGVAFSGGFYYVMGSHGHPRDKKGKLTAREIRARISASSQMVRFRATGRDGNASEIERTPRLREIIAAEPLLAPFMDRRLDKNGLTIEGVAIKGDLVLAGFRGPVLDGNRAVILSVRIDTLFGGAGSDHRLFRLPLGDGRGVRDLAVFEDSILILAGPARAGPGVYAIYSWDGESKDVRRLAELSSFDPERKPEALLPLGRASSGLRVLILFDSEKKGAPTPVKIEAP